MGVLGLEAPGESDSFWILPGFRARRERETSVGGGADHKHRALLMSGTRMPLCLALSSLLSFFSLLFLLSARRALSKAIWASLYFPWTPRLMVYYFG